MYAFIVNPNSRSGLGLKIWEQLELILKERHIDYQIYFTRRPGHGTKLAAQICDTDADTLVVLGGDGTIGEVVDGIRDLTKMTLAYIPIGSGNDFARSMKLTKDPTKALLHILNPTDYAYINVGFLKTPQLERRYAVSSGIGFDADVCYHNNLSSKLKHFLNKCKLGKLSYTAIALHLLLTSNPKSMRITLDDQKPITFPKVYFIAAMNQRYEGGGFEFCPKADPKDDLLDIIVVSGLSKFKILCLLPTAYKGKHTKFKGIYTYQCKSAKIESVQVLPVHTDGEADLRSDTATFALEPDRIRFIRS